MIFGKKEGKGSKGKLPDLPAPRYMGGAVVNSPLEREDIESLPSFPDSPNGNSFSQAAIKDAVNDSNAGLDEEKNITEMEEWKPSGFKTSTGMSNKNESSIEEGGDEIAEEGEAEEEPVEEEQDEEIEEEAPRRRESSRIQKEITEKPKNEDIFVKIDKFHSARRTLYDLKVKLEEINGLLKKIRETRLREEQELAAWEKELLHAKTRIQNVTENIFEKVD